MSNYISKFELTPFPCRLIEFTGLSSGSKQQLILLYFDLISRIKKNSLDLNTGPLGKIGSNVLLNWHLIKYISLKERYQRMKILVLIDSQRDWHLTLTQMQE